jgi:hypothetical protein
MVDPVAAGRFAVAAVVAAAAGVPLAAKIKQ